MLQLKVINSNVTQWDFLHAFRRQLFELVEFSLSADTQNIGTLIHGSSRSFVDDIFKYTISWKGYGPWQQKITDVLKGTTPSSYLFKVDWENNTATTGTFYFRYMNGMGEDVIFKLLGLDNWEQTSHSLKGMAMKFGIGQPVSVGIRANNTESIPVSVYYDIGKLKIPDAMSITTAVTELMQWPADSILRMNETLMVISRVCQPQYMALDPSNAVIKINYPKVSVQDFYRFMDLFNTEASRKNEVRSICRQWKQPFLNYLGIKFNQCECGWKAYLVISHQHTATDFSYTLKL